MRRFGKYEDLPAYIYWSIIEHQYFVKVYLRYLGRYLGYIVDRS